VALLGATGNLIPSGYVPPSATDHSTPSMVALQDGRLLFTWAEDGAGQVTIRGAYVSASGIVSAPFTLVAAFESPTADHSVVEMADGRLILTFSQTDAIGRPDAMRQILDPREAAITHTGTAQSDSWVGTQFGDVLNGNGGNDLIDGGGGNDILLGGIGSDTLGGGAASDNLWGGAGADAHSGGDGLDYARYDDANHGNLMIRLDASGLITGAAAGDTYAGIEGLVGGIGNDTVVGDTQNNYLFGNGGVDLIYGGVGNDVFSGDASGDNLWGGAGADRFRFSTALGVNNVDHIADFQHLVDDILLVHSVFAGIGATLTADEFRIGMAQDANDRILYNNITGQLYSDSNANAAGGMILFATVTAGTVLTFDGFVMVEGGLAADTDGQTGHAG
jgi:Ca2+-binding RTX toxin-like protein